jgi:hypothetical protein
MVITIVSTAMVITVGMGGVNGGRGVRGWYGGNPQQITVKSSVGALLRVRPRASIASVIRPCGASAARARCKKRPFDKVSGN